MDFNGHPVFPFRLNYSENIDMEWLNDISANHLSPSALGYLDGQRTIRKRRLSVSVMVNGSLVQEIEDFLDNTGCNAFWLPDVPREFTEVTDNTITEVYVEGGDLAAYIDSSLTYALMCFPNAGGDPEMGLISDIAVSGDGYVLTLSSSIGSISSDTHECSLAALVTVADDNITFNPITSELFELSLKLTEQPMEVADPISEVSIEYRYTFSMYDHLGSSKHFKYTTGDSDATYTAVDIIHNSLSFGLMNDSKCSLTMQAIPGGPFANWSPFHLGPPLSVTIQRVTTTDGTPATVQLFHGECVEMVREGSTIDATFEPRTVKGRIPNFFASVRDNSNPWTVHNVESYGYDTALISREATKITVTWNPVNDKTLLEGGYLVYSGGDLAEVRDILSVTGLNGDTLLELRVNGPITAGAGSTIRCYTGYDGSIESYADIFGDIDDFGGHPMITTVNPSFKAIEISVEAGKK